MKKNTVENICYLSIVFLTYLYTIYYSIDKTFIILLNIILLVVASISLIHTIIQKRNLWKSTIFCVSEIFIINQLYLTELFETYLGFPKSYFDAILAIICVSLLLATLFQYHFGKNSKRESDKEHIVMLESEQEKSSNSSESNYGFSLFNRKIISIIVIIFAILSYFYIAKFDFWSDVNNAGVENVEDVMNLHETAVLNYAHMLVFYMIVIIAAVIIIWLLLSSIFVFAGKKKNDNSKSKQEEKVVAPFKIDGKKIFFAILYIFILIAYLTKNQKLSWDNFSKYFLGNNSIIIVISILMLYLLIIFFAFILLSALYRFRGKIVQKSRDLVERILKICKNTLENIISLIEFLSTDLFASIVFLLKEQPDNEEEIEDEEIVDKKEEEKVTEEEK